MASSRRSSTNTPSTSFDQDIREAEERANKNAEEAYRRTTSDVGFVGGVAPQPESPSHQSKERPADAGFVYSSPKDLAERQGGLEGGTMMARLKDKNEYEMLNQSKGDQQATTETVSAEGTPDLPAIIRHNKSVADSAIVSRIGSDPNFPRPGTRGEATLSTDAVDGDYSNVIEGNVAETIDDPAKHGGQETDAKK